MMKFRHERFGGIIASEQPPFLAFVDKTFMLELGLGQSPLWLQDESSDVLSAPTEVHFSVTNRCMNRCAHCYMDSGEADPGEMDTQTFKRALEHLAKMGVFHVAMGGGDALLRDDLFELAGYARQLGLVPNLTVAAIPSGFRDIERLRAFGQINLSLDGVEERFSAFRRGHRFELVDDSLDRLARAGISPGINCVLGRRNFEGLADLFAYARDKGLLEIEFLRFKPSGRGRGQYCAEKTTEQQNRVLWLVLQKLSERFGVACKIDCSFVPMLCYHHPDTEILTRLATYGCEAGNVLLGVRSNGLVAGCSFLPSSGLTVFELKERWRTDRSLLEMREISKTAREPCVDCDYLTICKGGCHAVALSETGSLNAPDPDCPFVVDHTRKRR